MGIRSVMRASFFVHAECPPVVWLSTLSPPLRGGGGAATAAPDHLTEGGVAAPFEAPPRGVCGIATVSGSYPFTGGQRAIRYAEPYPPPPIRRAFLTLRAGRSRPGQKDR